MCYACTAGPGISNVKDFFTMQRLLAQVTIILNANQLQSDASSAVKKPFFSLRDFFIVFFLFFVLLFFLCC